MGLGILCGQKWVGKASGSVCDGFITVPHTQNAWVIGGGRGGSLYCYVVVIIEMKQASLLFSLPLAN